MFLDPNYIIYGSTFTGLAGLGLRTVFARAATSRDLKNAAITVEKSQTAAQERFAPPGKQTKKNLVRFASLLRAEETMRQGFMAEFEKLNIKEIEHPPSHHVLSDEWARMGTTLMTGAAGIELYKFSSVYSSHIQAMMTASHASAVAEHAPTIISFADAKIIEALDKAGVSDFVATATKGLAEHISPYAVDSGLTLLHEMMLPGVMTGIMTTIGEAKLAFDGDTNWEDTILYGVLPAFGMFAMVKAGMAAGAAVDAAAVGSTLGAGTVVGGIAGLGGAIFLKEKYIGKQIDEDKAALAPHADRIRSRRTTGIREINTIIADYMNGAIKLRDSYPEIFGSEKLKDIFARMAKAAREDFVTALEKIETDFTANVDAIPERNWLKKIAFVDTADKVKEIYFAAANDQMAQLQRTASDFLADFEKDPRQAVRILVDSSFLKEGKLEEFFSTLEKDLRDISISHDGSCKKWGADCKTHWETGQAAVSGKQTEHESLMQNLRTELAAIINPLRQRIKGNCRRLGRAPDPLIYV